MAFLDWVNRGRMLLAQMGEKGEGAAQKDGAEPGGNFFDTLIMWAPAILLMVLVYFLLAGRPQQKQQAKHQEMLKNLKKNDRVVTAGGILGTVVNAREDSEYITLRVDDSSNAKMQILKTSIVRVLGDEAEKEKKSDASQ